MTEEKRKLRAKRFNEHVKLLVTTVNAIALITAGAGAISPLSLQEPAPCSHSPPTAFGFCWVLPYIYALRRSFA